MALIPYFYRMKCVIFGLGWLGLPLAEQLLEKGFKVTGTTRSEKALIGAQLDHRIYQPTLPSQLDEIVDGAAIIVLAFPPNKSSLDAYSNECLTIVQSIPSTAKVILISSTSIYPDCELTYKEQDILPDPQAEQAILRCEGKLQTYLNDRLSIVRMGGLVGGNRWPVRFMSQSGKTYASSEVVNLIHQKDAVGMIVHLIENDLFGVIVNACAPAHPSKKEHYSLMAKQLEIAAPLFDDNATKGKIIDSSLSIELGYTYQFPDPNQFS